MNQYKKILKFFNNLILKNNIEKLKPYRIGSGAHAKCYRFNKYVIINSMAYKKFELEELKSLTSKLKNRGANIVPILDYEFSSYDGFYSHNLILQPFCEGKSLYSNMHPNENNLKDLFNSHLEETKNIAKLDINLYKKFIKDYFLITKSGIQIDNEVLENFIVNKNGINFIDLQMRHTLPPQDKWVSNEIINVLIGYDYDYIFDRELNNKNANELNQLKKTILNKSLEALDQLGFMHPSKEELLNSKNYYVLPQQKSLELNA